MCEFIFCVVLVFCFFFFFFFQAEDGIRDAQESRGLGDVYKRQIKHRTTSITSNNEDGTYWTMNYIWDGLNASVTEDYSEGQITYNILSVSYTHLTLPTKRIV